MEDADASLFIGDGGVRRREEGPCRGMDNRSALLSCSYSDMDTFRAKRSGRIVIESKVALPFYGDKCHR